MTRIRMLVYASVGALAFVPALASAEEPYGGQRYGAPIHEDVDVGETQAEPLAPEEEMPAQPPTEGEPMEHDGEMQQPPPAQPGFVEPSPTAEVEEEEEEGLLSRIGIAVSAGGGVTDFVDNDMDRLTDLGGAYEARFTLGTRSLVGMEIAYIGSVQDIEALGLDDDAALLQNGLETLLRVNVGTFDIQPYVAAGVGWSRYDIINEDFNTSSVNDDDDIVTVPVAAGLSTYIGGGGFMLDGRFTYRAAFEEDLLQPGTGNEAEEDLDNWAVTLRVGYEF